MYEMRIPQYPVSLLTPEKQHNVPNFFNVDDLQRVAIFVDGPSISSSGKVTGDRLNYENLRLMMEQHSDLRVARYYSPQYSPDDNGMQAMQKFLEYLSHTRWDVQLRQGYYTGRGEFRTLGVEAMLCSHMQLLATSGKVDTILLVTNDGDYGPVMQTLKLTYGIKFLHLAWSAQGADNKYINPNRIIKMESDVSLDIAMVPITKHLIRGDA